MRMLNVCSPWRNRNALNGESAGTDVALVLEARLEDVLRGPQRVGQLREDEAVVARVGLGEAGEPTARDVVERAAVDDDAADRRAVTADELRGRVHDDVGTVPQRLDEVRARERVVDHERDAVVVRDLRDAFEVEDVALGVADALAVERLGVRADRGLPRGEVVGVDEASPRCPSSGTCSAAGCRCRRRATCSTRCARRSRRGSAARPSARPARSRRRAHPTPPSSATMRCSNASCVGFMIRV